MIINRYAGGVDWPELGQDGTLWDEVEPMPRALYSTHDACLMLGGIDHKTLQRWAKAAGIVPGADPIDKRVAVWTHGQLRAMADLRHRQLGKPPAESDTSRMRRLEAELEAVRQRLARLEGQTIAPQASQERQEPAEDGGHAQLEALRQKRILARQRDVPRLPDGWVAYSSWCELHDLNKRTADRYVSSGRLVQPQRDLYVNPATGQRVERVYDPQQQALAAEQLATIRRQEASPPSGSGADESEASGDGRAF